MEETFTTEQLITLIILFASDLPLYFSIEELSFGDVHSVPGHSQFQLFSVLTGLTGHTFACLKHTDTQKGKLTSDFCLRRGRKVGVNASPCCSLSSLKGGAKVL